MATADAIKAIQERFSELELTPQPLMVRETDDGKAQMWLRIPSDRILEVAQFARDDQRTKFEQLNDLAGVDYLNYPGAEDRYAVVYSLLSLTYNHRLWLKVFLNDPNPEMPSVTSIWRGAEWPEREVFDLLGIRFTGHPDLRRIMLPDIFTDHPLRKDYPLRGKGERRQFDIVTRESV